MLRIAVMVVTTLMISACVATTHNMQTPFSAKAHMPYTKVGNASVKGQAFLKRNDGQVVTCAGSKVALMPDTEYTREIVGAISKGHNINQKDIEEARTLLKKAGATQTAARESMCDANGNFTFKNLPAGNWIVATEVVWNVSTIQGGGLLKKVKTTKGQTTEVLITSADKI